MRTDERALAVLTTDFPGWHVWCSRDGRGRDWDTAYQIEHDGEDGWHARRLDGLGGRLAADSPDGLFAAITADYTLKPVPRPEPGA